MEISEEKFQNFVDARSVEVVRLKKSEGNPSDPDQDGKGALQASNRNA